MAEEALAKAGLYFDELNKIRVCDPKASQNSSDLKDHCSEFITNLGEFKDVSENVITLMDSLAKQVEQEKMKAIGSRNLLNSVKKQKEAEKQQLEALIEERRTELER